MSSKADEPAASPAARELPLIAAARQQVERARSGGTGGSAASASAGAGAGGPAMLPGYQLVREIHSGGQGVVYEAIQKVTRRAVAVKFMRPTHFVSAADHARFEREVQILGALRHPNIVTIYDSGVVDGTAYLVMDLVRGLSLDEWVAEQYAPAPGEGSPGRLRHRPPREVVQRILRLFEKVCEGVHAAHVRGIIHRDLKPANIRVDGDGAPRVLDFGLARLTGDLAGEPGSRQTLTLAGEFLGTLAYASPEQVSGDPQRIDVRTDVYSLGVMLYRALTGQFPYRVSGSVHDVFESILSAAPARPALAGVRVNGEIETIVLKCLNKAPERRYQSAGELAEDIRRYLEGRPIAAKRDSAAYVLRKFLRRHRLAAGSAAAFLLTLAGTSVLLGVLYGRQGELLAAVQAERDEADAARRTADEARRRAEREARRAGAVARFQREMLAAADPFAAEHPQMTVKETLDAARRQLEAGSLASEPEVEASVRATLGGAYLQLGQHAEGEPQLRRALELRRAVLGADHLDTAESLRDLAKLLRAAGRFDEAEALARESLEIVLRAAGPDSGPSVESRCELALILSRRGDYDAAEPLLRETLRVARTRHGAGYSDAASVLENLGEVLRGRGQLAEAESVLREALAARQREADRNPLRPTVAMDHLADVLEQQDKLDEAEVLYRRALEIRREYLPDPHPEITVSLNRLGMILAHRGRLAEAAAVAEQVLERSRARFGDVHPDVATALGNLAKLRLEQGDYAGAEGRLRESLAVLSEIFPGDHPTVASQVHNLAVVLHMKGAVAEAAETHRSALAMRRRLFGSRHPAVADSEANLGATLRDLGQWQEAEELLRAALQARRELLGEGHVAVGLALSMLAGVLCERARLELEPSVETTVDASPRGVPTREPGAARSPLLDEAERTARQALDILLERLPPGNYALARTQVVLGGILLELGRFEEAETLLLEGGQVLRASPLSPPQRKREAVAQLVRLYGSWGRVNEAQRWRAELAALEPAAGD